MDEAATGRDKRHAIREELERRSGSRRLTPAHRKIAQCLIENSGHLGFLSSMELAELAGVSQPSVTRFAMTLGFKGYLEMRRALRGVEAQTRTPETHENRFQAMLAAEIKNLAELSARLRDAAELERWGSTLAESSPLPVLGLRAAAGLARRFCYFAAKIHPDVRLLEGGGSMLEEQLEQAWNAGGSTALFFMMPLYPRETIRAMEYAKQLGFRVALVSDAAFHGHTEHADLHLAARVNSSLVFDSYAAASALSTILLDALYSRTKGASKRLEQLDRISRKRKVFAGDA